MTWCCVERQLWCYLIGAMGVPELSPTINIVRDCLFKVKGVFIERANDQLIIETVRPSCISI